MKKKDIHFCKAYIWILPDPEIHIFWHFCVAACRCFLTSASFTLSNKAEPAFYTHSLSCRVAHPALPSLCVCVCVWLTDSALVSIHIACWVRLFSLSAEPALPSAPLWPCLSHFCWLLYCAPVCVCARLCVCRCVSTHSFLFRPTVLGVLDCIWLNRNWISWQRQNEQSVNQQLTQENITNSHFLPSDINRTGNWETRALTSPLTSSDNEPLCFSGLMVWCHFHFINWFIFLWIRHAAKVLMLQVTIQ